MVYKITVLTPMIFKSKFKAMMIKIMDSNSLFKNTSFYFEITIYYKILNHICFFEV